MATVLLLPGLTLRILDSKVEVSFECEPGAFDEVDADLRRSVSNGVTGIDLSVGNDFPKFFFVALLRGLARTLKSKADVLANHRDVREPTGGGNDRR